MNNKRQNFSTWIVAIALTAVAASSCAGGPLTAREKGAGIGALGGAAVGGAIGSAKGHPLAARVLARRNAGQVDHQGLHDEGCPQGHLVDIHSPGYPRSGRRRQGPSEGRPPREDA